MFAELIKRSSIANIVAGTVIVVACVYAVLTGNDELMRALALIASGYLFGASIRGVGGGGEHRS